MKRKMKPSGVAWIGAVPEGWGVAALKYGFDIGSGSTPETSVLENFDGDVPWVTPADFKTKDHYVGSGRRNLSRQGLRSCSAEIVPEGSLIFSKRAPVGAVSISSNALATNQGCITAIPTGIFNVNYTYYATSIATRYFELLSAGTTFLELSLRSFSDFKIPLPPLPEQRRIAAYLDRQCGKIDALSAKIDEEIAKLGEYKKSLITECVTGKRSVDGAANRRMKPSGIAWIGAVPEGWGVVAVKHVYDLILGKMVCSSPENQTSTLEKYYCAANVHFEGVSNEDLKEMWFTKAELSQYAVKKGDLLVVEGGAGAGGAAIVKDVNGYVGVQNSVMIVRHKPVSDNRILCYWLEFLVKSGYVDFVCNKATIPHFTKEKLGSVMIPLPPLPEQRAIAAYLDRQCGKIDEESAALKRQKEKLAEYRKSLIFECVTGKREVV